MKIKIMILTLMVMTVLAGCNNTENEEAQPQIGENAGQVRNVGNDVNTTNVTQRFDNPYKHNYNGQYSGEQQSATKNEIRSAQQVASRASETAEQVTGVDNATSVVQGMDIVVGIEANEQGNGKALENRVKQAISRTEQGYNVYVTSDRDIHERIQTLFTNLNNVKTSNVTSGIGDIIYDIGQSNGH